jgi:hypothetical protein
MDLSIYDLEVRIAGHFKKATSFDFISSVDYEIVHVLLLGSTYKTDQDDCVHVKLSPGVESESIRDYFQELRDYHLTMVEKLKTDLAKAVLAEYNRKLGQCGPGDDDVDVFGDMDTPNGPYPIK